MIKVKFILKFNCSYIVTPFWHIIKFGGMKITHKKSHHHWWVYGVMLSVKGIYDSNSFCFTHTSCDIHKTFIGHHHHQWLLKTSIKWPKALLILVVNYGLLIFWVWLYIKEMDFEMTLLLIFLISLPFIETERGTIL